jgi:hypothetical protein
VLAALYDSVLGAAGATERASALLQEMYDRWAPSEPPFAGTYNGFDALIGVSCADTEYPDRTGTWVRDSIVLRRRRDSY